MRNTLKKYGVDFIWHFTERGNLDNIIKHGGLYSWNELNGRGIPTSPGGNDWSHDADGYKGVDRFVHLAFIDDHPMLYTARNENRIKDPVWLKISTEILDFKGVMYTNDVSNKAGVPLLTNDEAKQKIDFDVLYTYMDWRLPEVRQRRNTALKGEILIPNVVPIEMILGKKNG